jgi:Ca-activated chloride channel family protein
MLQHILSFGLSLLLLPGTGPSRDASSASPAEVGSSDTEMTIRKTVEEVHLDFALSFQGGRPVPGLKADEVTIYQDGRPASPITAFYADQNLPLHLLLMIDASDSMTRGFAAERNAASRFLTNVVRPGIDHSAAASFSTHLTFDPNQDASSPQAILKIGLLRSQGLTALYDSLYESAAAFRAYDGEQSASRRVLVLLSDGDDNYSLHSLGAAIAAVQKSNVIIYAISAHNPGLIHAGDAALERICSETGGRFFVVNKFEESEKVFAEIEQEIRGQYSVRFRASRDACGYHTLRVEPADHTLRARSRAGFYGDCQ